MELDSQYKFLKSLFSEVINIINQNNAYFNTSNLTSVDSSINNDETIENDLIEIKFKNVNVKLADNNDSIEAIIALLRAHKKL